MCSVRFDPDAPVLEQLADVADATIDDCLREGATWTLLRVLERRSPLPVIVIVRRLRDPASHTARCSSVARRQNA